MMATPRSASRLTNARSAFTSCAGSELVGSSRMRTFGLKDTALAISTICRWGTLSRRTISRGFSATPIMSSASVATEIVPAMSIICTPKRPRRGQRPRRIFSATDNPMTRLISW